MSTRTKNTVVGKVNIEQLLAKKNQISNAAIQAAIAKMEEAKQKAQEEQVIQHLATIQSNTEAAVEQLRNFRKKEKAAKEYLTAVATAEQVFYTNADYNQYSVAVNTAYSEFRKNS